MNHCHEVKLKEEMAASSFAIDAKDWFYAKLSAVPTDWMGILSVMTDESETTAVVVSNQLDRLAPLEVEGPFVLCRLDVATPFQAVGFLAAISQALADCGLNVLLISTFSKDYVLVDHQKRGPLTEALNHLGLRNDTAG